MVLPSLCVYEMPYAFVGPAAASLFKPSPRVFASTFTHPHSPSYRQSQPQQTSLLTTMKSPTAVAAQTSATIATPHSYGLVTVPETTTPVSLPVSGTIPSYLATSTLYRIGPGAYEAPHSDGENFTIRHWFDGFALLHSFSIDSQHQTVTYRSSNMAKPTFRSIAATPSSSYAPYTFGRGDPCRSVLGKFFQLFTKLPADPKTGRVPPFNTNVTVEHIPDKGLVARTDGYQHAKFDEDTLEADHFFRTAELDPNLKGDMSAAHGHFDASTNEYINYTFEIGPGQVKYTVFKIVADGSVHVLAKFSEKPCYLHSFAVTDNYVVLCVWPLEIASIFGVMFNKSLMDGLKFNRHADTRFYVISRRDGGVVAKYTSAPFFCFHTINAFEDDDSIHIDLCRYDDSQVLDDFMLVNLRNATTVRNATTLSRFTLGGLQAAIAAGPGQVKRAGEKVVSDYDVELPRINPANMRRPYRFVYGLSEEKRLFDVVSKVDVVTGERETWGFEGGVLGEPIFVADPAGKREDDGCLLVVALDSKQRKSCMVIIDAKSMKEIGRATVPKVVPLGFHGMIKM